MAYGKSNYKKRYYGGAKKYSSFPKYQKYKNPQYKKYAGKKFAARVASTMEAALNRCDYLLTGTTAGSSTIVSSSTTNDGVNVVNVLREGTAQQNRIGRKIQMKSLSLRVAIQNDFLVGTPQVSQLVRIAVVYDKQPNGVIPTFDAIFGKIDQAGTQATTVLDPMLPQKMDRFRVLRDKIIEVMPYHLTSAGVIDEQILMMHQDYIKLDGYEATYSASASPATIAEIQTGALYVILRVVNGTSAVSTINPVTSVRLVYTP